MSLWSGIGRAAGDIVARIREGADDAALGVRDGFSFPAGKPVADPAMRAGQVLGKGARHVADDPVGSAAVAGVGAGAGLGLKAAFGEAAGNKLDDASAVQRVIELQQQEGRRFTAPEIVEILVAQGMRPEQAEAIASRVLKARRG
jgi:hypothetical protein